MPGIAETVNLMDCPSALAVYVMPCLHADDVARLRGTSSAGIVAFNECTSLGTVAVAASANPLATRATWDRWFPLSLGRVQSPHSSTTSVNTVCLCGDAVFYAETPLRGLWRGGWALHVIACTSSVAASYVASVPLLFLSSTNVVDVDLSGLHQVTALGDHCLSSTPSLRSVVLPPSLVTIGTCFCMRSGIAKLDFGHLAQLTSVGSHLLTDAYIVDLDMSGLDQLASLHDRCMAHTPALRSVVLPPSLKTIGVSFCDASGIERLDFGCCPQLASVGANFLRGSRVTDVDMSGLDHLATLGEYCMSHMPWLRSVTLPPSITTIGSNFGWQSGIERLDFGHLPQLTSIGSELLKDSAIVELNMSGLAQLVSLGDDCMSRTPALRSVVLPPSVTTIGRSFCNPSGISRVDFRHLSCLRSVGAECVAHDL